MPGIYSMMDISKWALYASQAQLEVVSHNVANVNTPGYSRQVAVLGTANPEYTSEGWYGHGVSVETVISITDDLLTARLTDKATDLAYYEERLTQLQRLEALANEAGDSGLGADITAFFNAWQDLSNNPQSTAVREALLETANNLVSRFQGVMNDLNSVQRDINGYMADGVERVNSILRSIAELNVKIVGGEAGGDKANDYRDERTRLLNELSGYMDIQWFETGDGSVSVLSGAGHTLVQSGYPDSDDPDVLAFAKVDGETFNQVIWTPGNLTLGTEQISGGSIGAWLQVRDEDIPEMLDFFNGLAGNVIYEVNELHSQGVGLEKKTSVSGDYQAVSSTRAMNASGNLAFGDRLESGTLTMWIYGDGTQREATITVDPSWSMADLVSNMNTAIAAAGGGVTASVTTDNRLQFVADDGTEFAFGADNSNALAVLGVNTFFSGTTATSMAISDDVASDVRQICAGRLTETGEHGLGDVSNALDIADLKDANTMYNDTETFNEALISWAATLGTLVDNTSDNVEFASLTMTELSDLRDSFSGVNLDEELVRMIQFQRSYQAAAQMISVADELLQTLLQTKS